MQQIGLTLHIPNTQPPGTSGDDVRRACTRAYFPLLELIEEFPAIRLSMHWSGQLLEWMDLHAPEHLERLVALAQSGRVEIVGGLHGGGVLPALPERDAVGQIQQMMRWWKQHGDPRIRGAWLPYCAWDPGAARVLGRMGLHYTLLEESQFSPPVSGDGYYLTEREGTALAIFCVSGRLSRMLPDAPPKRILEQLKLRARKGHRSVTLSVPGEAFGAALESSATRCFDGKRGWVRRFFTELTENQHWLKLVSFSTVVDRLRPTAVSYPQASTSLPVAAASLGGLGSAYTRLVFDIRRGEDPGIERAAPFVRPASWEQVLGSFPEINRLHKRMLRASREVLRLRNMLREEGKRGEGEGLAEALEEATAALYRGQNGAAYVLGTDIGAQDGDIRAQAWANLLRAEYTIAAALGEAGRLSVEQADYDCDGRPEVLVRTPSWCGIVAPAQGGALVELDSWSLPGNVLNVRTRLPESHHDVVQRGENLPYILPDAPDPATIEIEDEEATDEDTADEVERPVKLAEVQLHNKLHIDRSVRASFVDHFFGPEATLDNVRKARFPETGDFVGAEYQQLSVEDDENSATITLARDGNVTEGAALRLVRVVKRYVYSRDLPVVDVRYEVSNRYHEPIRTRFAVELNLNLDSARHGETFLETAGGKRYPLTEAGELEDLTEISLVDINRGWRLTVSLQQQGRLWHFPIETVSRTPAGLASLYQGTALYFWWPMELWGTERRRIDLSLSLEA